MLRGQAAQLRLEGPAEGAHIGIAAGVADLGQGHVRVPHQQAGLADPDRVDEPAEIGVHPFREEVAQVGHADAQGPGGALQGDFLKGMVGDIVDDPVAQLLLAVVIDRTVGKVVEQAGQDHVQIGDAQGQVVLHGQAAQPADREAEVHTGLGRGQEGAFRLEAVEGARVFRNDVRRENGGNAVDVLAHFVIAVGHQGKNNGGVPGIHPVGRFVNGHDGGAPGDDHQLRHGMDVGGESVVGHLTDKHLFRTLLIESTHGQEPPFFAALFVRSTQHYKVCSDPL